MTSRRLLVAGALLVVIAAAVLLLPVSDLVTRLAGAARGAGVAGVVVFFIAYVVSTVAVLPGSLLTLAAGFAYGPVWGLVIASPASVVAATVAFVLGRTLLREWVSARIGASARARAIDAAVEHEGFKLVLLLRLSPLFPYSVLNYVLSLTRVRLGAYVLASTLGMLPGTALYVYLGSLAPAAAQLTTASSGAGRATTVLYVVGLIATIVVVVVATRVAGRAVGERVPGGNPEFQIPSSKSQIPTPKK